MAQFLTTSGIASSLEVIIRDAQTAVTLISPFVKLSPDLLHRLKDAAARGIDIRVVYGKESLNSTEWQKIAELDRVRVFFLQRLHAKCFMNEAHAVITSMNLYEFSEKNNREMGVLLERGADADAFRRVAAEVESIGPGGSGRDDARYVHSLRKYGPLRSGAPLVRRLLLRVGAVGQRRYRRDVLPPLRQAEQEFSCSPALLRVLPGGAVREGVWLILYGW